MEVLKTMKRMLCAVILMAMIFSARALFAQSRDAQTSTADKARISDNTLADKTIAGKTKDAQKLAGYFNVYWDAKAGKLWLEIDKWDSDFLYQSSLSAGIGSKNMCIARSRANTS